MSIQAKYNVNISGQGKRAMVFAHGFGCDQHMWRMVAPAFEQDYQVILFDHIGAGGSDLQHYDPARYDTLDQYASDVLELCDALQLEQTTFVGHSVSALIGLLAAARSPHTFERLVLVGPSPCYINQPGYRGGFEAQEIDGLLDFLDDNFVAWSRALAPTIMGNGDRPELGAELENSFCRTDPAAARQFARVTFLSDRRADLAAVNTPSLILQCRDDAIAPEAVGHYMHAALRGSAFHQLAATGHCPHLSAPEETVAAIQSYLARSAG